VSVVVSVIGVGHWGPNLARNFANDPNVDLRWVVDRDEGRLEQVRRSLPGVKTTTAVEDVWTDGDVDAVAIATPTSTHGTLVEQALLAGMHVLVEKPITNDSASGDALVRLAAERDLVLMVGHVFLFNEAVLETKRIIDSGELGEIFHVAMVRTNLGPIRYDVDVSWDLAPHDLSIANYLLGTQPVGVSAMGGSWINSDIADALFATLRYPDNVLVNLHLSWLSPRKVRDITIVGSDKMLTLDDMNLSEPIRIHEKWVSEDRSSPAWTDNYLSFRSSVRDGSIHIPKVALSEPLAAECRHFIGCVQSGETPRSDGAFGVDVVRVLEATQRSMQNAGQEQVVT
jgi:predicted dehydrogenase